MLRTMCYVLMSACIILTTASLPVAVSGKKDSKFCCKCTVDGDESTGKVVTNLGSGFINTVNLLARSLTGCGGLTATMVSGTDGEFISNGGAGLINAYVGRPGAAVQLRIPQVHFPAPINIIPHQQYLLYNLQPLQLSFFNLQQPKVTTQCCMPCLDGNGICCCTPGATTTRPHDSHNLHHPAGAKIPLKSTSLLVSTITLLVLDHVL
ncbi:hypothetical protein WUBG_10006 [Wuchereria bancrofti]|nr:hypothetical protein WUBG_10006 [Wuchereria bancrofti]VDM07900.1 unnamed protein product [Wuchereria bancrofti]